MKYEETIKEKEPPKARQQMINEAAREGNIEKLYSLLAREAGVLEELDGKELCETPLHAAAREGHTEFAMEVMNLKPSLAEKLDESGLSPMDLALRHGHDRMVKVFTIMNSKLIGIKGRGGYTPLHYVAAEGNTELLSEFLYACPSSVEVLTSKCETVVHIAVKNKRVEVVEVLIGWLSRVNQEEMLSWKDDHGNTALHIAASTGETKLVKLLCKNVNVNAKNFDGETAMDICESKRKGDRDGEMYKALRRASAKPAKELQDNTTTLAGFLSKDVSLFEKRNRFLGISNFKTEGEGSKNTSSQQDMVLVVSVLIATATYQAGLSPPGGYWQEDSNSGQVEHVAGQMTMDYFPALFFFTFNGIAFFTSMAVIMFYIIAIPTWQILCGSIVALGISNMVSFAYTFPDSDDTGQDVGAFILQMAYPVVATFLVMLPLVSSVIHHSRRQKVDTLKGGISANLDD